MHIHAQVDTSQPMRTNAPVDEDAALESVVEAEEEARAGGLTGACFCWFGWLVGEGV